MQKVAQDSAPEAFHYLMVDALRLMKGRMTAQEFHEASAAFVATVEESKQQANQEAQSEQQK